MSLKSLFVKEEIIPAKSTSYNTIPATQTFNTTGYAQPMQTFSVVNSSIDPDIKNTLIQSLQDNKLSGFDYLKFVAALDQMKSVAPSEESRFKMTFIAAQQLGVDKSKLIESANHYIDVLKQDLTDFKADFSSKQTEVVGNNETKLNEVNNTITSLQTQLSQLLVEQTKLASIISENKVKLENKRSTFETTHSSVVNEITDNIKKINQYL